MLTDTSSQMPIVLMQYYYLKDTIWVLILPYLVFAWYILLLRTFLAALQREIIEAAQMVVRQRLNRRRD